MNVVCENWHWVSRNETIQNLKIYHHNKLVNLKNSAQYFFKEIVCSQVLKKVEIV